ncbi:MAG: S9 family peptidase [Candidatus Cloacimonetes bacterium]|nr:S9 family peptidase [Candidatus Cloacimonadota bacterium]
MTNKELKNIKDFQPAKKIPVTLTTAGHQRVDNYFWLNERDNPEVIAYLEAENSYTNSMMNDTEKLQEKLFSEITSRIEKDDKSVPYFHNEYYYYSRFEEEGEYPIYCRKKGSLDAQEEIILDGNKMAEDYSYFNIGDFSVSPDNKLLAYCIDTMGRFIFTTMFKDLQSGETIGACIENTDGSLAWADDNKSLFYVLKNPETLRSEKLMLHVLNGNQPDKLIYVEEDESFYMHVYRSKSEKMILLSLSSHTQSEYRFLNSAEPTGNFKIVQPREEDLEYRIDHFEDKFFIVTNYQAKNFRLMETNIDNSLKENWKEVIAHRDDVLLEKIEIFKDFLVVSERKNGLIQLRIIPVVGDEHYMIFDEPDYLTFIGLNPSFNTEKLRFCYTSLTTPFSTFEYDMITREKTLLKQQKIVGGYNPDEYVAKRLYATAKDGKNIPISLVYRKDTVLNGKTALLLYGYGAYGYSIDPMFSLSRISLLDRGFIYAIAHIRGGETLGRQWYDDGKLLNKKNTFTDFIDCAEFLISEKYTDAEHLCASGGSAGGLLMGAVVNMRPELFKAILADVPFVDVITTMCDKSIPLTTGEFSEWGDPEDEKYYEYIMSYSPYDNVIAQKYPNMLITTGLHDSQVQYWEPAKWVAKLREFKTDDNLLLLYTNMDAGHSGASGRFEQYRQVVLQYAFLCKIMGNSIH